MIAKHAHDRDHSHPRPSPCPARSTPISVSGETLPVAEAGDVGDREAACSMIWSDLHASYSFLRRSKLYWTLINHPRNELARRDADGEVESTNSIEGLIGRLKKDWRHAHCRIIGKQTSYAMHLAESVWRTFYFNRNSQ